MPMKTGTSKFDMSKSLKTHAKDETDYGREIINLPAGINGGVAKLAEAKRSQYKTGPNEGKDFVYLAGVVVSPVTSLQINRIWEDEGNGKGKVKVLGAKEVKIEGQRTSVMIPLCETKTKDGKVTEADENVATMCNELRKLGGEECLEGVESEEDLDNLLATLKESAPYFKFSTYAKDPTKEYPTPKTWENWYGGKGLEDYIPGENGEVVDNSPQVSNDEKAGEAAAVGEEGEDLDELANLSDKKDTEAAEKLEKLAEDAGVPAEEVGNADNWVDVVKLIRAAKEGGEEKTTATDDEPFIPAKEEVYNYKPLDKKTGKPVKKGIEVEVTAVDKKKQTVTLLNLVDKKTSYKDVKWTELESGS